MATAIGACTLAWLVLCSPWLFGKLTIPYDAKAQFHAHLQFLANAIHTGQSPLWNPNQFAGSPQIADPQSLIFSPAILIALFTAKPGIGAIDGYAFALLACAVLAILAFFGDRGWHPIGGCVAALAFAFGASAAWRIQHIGQIQSFALFAVTLWLVARMLDRHSCIWGAAAGLAAGMMVVEPDQVALLACYVLAGYVLAHVCASGQRWLEFRRLVPPLAVAALAGTLVIALPVTLTYLFMENSNRPAISVLEAGRGSLHPASLLTAVIGDLYGALDHNVEYWGPYSTAWDRTNLTLSQNMSQLYVGALPIVLLLTVGVMRGRAWSAEIRYFTIALVAMIAYAVGTFTPLFGIAYDLVPGVRYFRRPADATFLIGGLSAVIAGYLAHLMVTGAVPHARTVRRGAECAVVAAVVAIGLLVAHAHGHLNDAIKPVAVATLFLGLAGGLCWIIARHGAARPLACLTLVAAAMTVDLAVNNGPNDSTALPVADYEFLEPGCRNATIALMRARLRQPPGSNRRDRVEFAGLGFPWPNFGMIHGIDHLLGYNPMRLDIADKAFGAGETIAGWDQRRFTPLFPSYRSRLADLLGLRYIATPVPIETVDPSLRPGDLPLIARTPDAYVYENPDALPRALFAERSMPADFARILATGRWPDFDPRATVLLEADADADASVGGVPDAPSVPEPAHAPPVVSIASYRNTAVDIDVTTSRAGYVVLNDVWQSWWRVTVDNRPVEMLRANVMFRAVRVPSGRHRVRFEFAPLIGAVADLARATGGSAHARPLRATLRHK